MASIVRVRRDTSGNPRCSLTFLLSRTPAPHEPIASLVLTATLAVDLDCELDDLAWVGFSLELDPPVRVEARGPFGQAALATTLAGEQAQDLLTALASGEGGPDLRIRARRTDGLTGQWTRPLVPVLTEAMGAEPDRVVHLVSAEGGTIGDVFPARSTRTRGPSALRPGVMMLRDQMLTPVSEVVRPQIVRLPPHVVAELQVAVPLNDGESGPVLSADPLMADRGEPVRWYLPEVSLATPPLGQDADESPFRYDLVTQGHQDDGTPGLEATIVLTLAAGPSAATSQAWEAAGKPAMQPLPCELLVGLRIPFRDESSTARSEVLPASSTAVQGVFGEAGSRVTATFVVKDRWARLAYGALSSPGFQAEPPAVQVSMTYSGWRATSRWQDQVFAHLATDKVLALRSRGDVKPMPKATVLGMARANLQLRPPMVVADPGWKQRLNLVQYTKVTTTNVQAVSAVLDCADHGQLYRQQGPAGWEALGCQEALKLGRTEYRLWQPQPVTSVTGVRVFRSLTQPGRYLLIPEQYGVGRHAADDPSRPLRPTLLLTSTIDVDDPANIRCVLAAALEPDLNVGERALLAAELRQRAGREVEVVTAWQAGIEPTISWAAPRADSLECVAIDSGFTVVLTTDIPGLLTLRTLLQRGGLVGSARYRLPGGDEAISTLRMDLGRVLGPIAGPVEVQRQGSELRLRNRLSLRVAVHRVVAGGQVVATPELLLTGGQEATVVLPGGALDPVVIDHSTEATTENLDESRSYIEDLELAVTFVATGDLAAVAGLEVACEFLGSTASPLLLSRTQRQGERQFVLPLTSYATDPAVRFTVTAVASDGTRTSAAPVDWPVRTRGVLIPIPTPTTTV